MKFGDKKSPEKIPSLPGYLHQKSPLSFWNTASVRMVAEGNWMVSEDREKEEV